MELSQFKIWFKVQKTATVGLKSKPFIQMKFFFPQEKKPSRGI